MSSMDNFGTSAQFRSSWWYHPSIDIGRPPTNTACLPTSAVPFFAPTHFRIGVEEVPFEHVHYARMALRKLVETQTPPGGVVAAVQTLQGSAARQFFGNDKQYLLRTMEPIQWKE